MNSELTTEFIELFRKLPEKIKILAAKNYRFWKIDPKHPGLNFKKIKGTNNVYSVRIGIEYRAIGTLIQNTVVWFWVGSHKEYDKIINNLS